MKKKLTCVAMAVMVAILSVCANLSVFAENSDPLSVYKARLQELNEMYGTDYAIPNETATGGDYSEIVEFFTSKTLEEFDEYITSIYDGSIYSSDDESIKTDDTNSIAPTSYTKLQRYYYWSGNKNYLWAMATIQYSDGYDRYTSFNTIGCNIESYPAYKPDSQTHTYSNGYRNMTVNFRVYTFLTSDIYSENSSTVSVTFSANGGDVYK